MAQTEITHHLEGRSGVVEAVLAVKEELSVTCYLLTACLSNKSRLPERHVLCGLMWQRFLNCNTMRHAINIFLINVPPWNCPLGRFLLSYVHTRLRVCRYVFKKNANKIALTVSLPGNDWFSRLARQAGSCFVRSNYTEFVLMTLRQIANVSLK